LQVLAASLPSV